jgi:hypothetical protein
MFQRHNQCPTFVAPLVFTLMLAGITIVMLIVWAIARSAASDTANDVDSSFLKVARNLLGVTLLSALLDVQPLGIHWLGSWLGKHHAVDLRSLFGPSALLAAAGAARRVIRSTARRLFGNDETRHRPQDTRLAHFDAVAVVGRRFGVAGHSIGDLLVSDSLLLSRSRRSAARPSGGSIQVRFFGLSHSRHRRVLLPSQCLFATSVLQGSPQQSLSVQAGHSGGFGPSAAA